MMYCISQSEKYFRRYLTLNPPILKVAGKNKLGPNKACDVESETEVILLVQFAISHLTVID